MNDISTTKAKISAGSVVLYVLIAIGAVLIIKRFIFGLGSVTNLNDSYPWGLWIGFDVLTGIALAAGGFTLTAGIYIWGNPSEAGPERLWGLPVAQSDIIAEGTGLVGSFEPSWIQLLERRGLTVEIGFVGTQFTEGEQTIRASVRTVLVIYRAAAFCTVTSI